MNINIDKQEKKMAEVDDTELSDEEENSLLVACVDSCESFAVGSLESLPEEFAEDLDDYSNFEESQNNNCDSGSPNSRNGSESYIIGTAASQQMAETLLKGSVLLRLVRSGYVWVSDLSSQAWCEMKMYYSFSLPLQMPVEVVEDPVMQIGSAIHLARQLNVQDNVSIHIESKEDSIGVKILNLLSAIKTFHSNGTLAREIPIFGAPFGKNLFVVGTIDELRFNPGRYTIDLVELKTRKNKTLPHRFMKRQHCFQVMLYCKLFDDLVKGLLTKKNIAENFQINLEKKFNPDLISHIMDSGFYFENLNRLLDYVLHVMQSLTCISQTYVEYVHQETMQSFAKEKVAYDEVELCHFFSHYADFWLGKRDPVGVDIEEAYKCQMCEHAHLCGWRRRKNEEYTQKKTTTNINELNKNKKQFI